MSRRPKWGASPRASPSARTGAISTWEISLTAINDILRLEGDKLVKVASPALPEHPASMRGTTPWGDTPNDSVFFDPGYARITVVPAQPPNFGEFVSRVYGFSSRS